MKYNKENPLKVVTLCSGYDSQCLALNRLKHDFPDFDYELVAWSEFDPETPNKPLEQQPAVVAHNSLFPQWDDRNLGDMTKIDWTKVQDFDLLFYSTPCQSISSAGLQHGFTEGSGTRSSIIWNVRDAVKTKRPKYLCLENVKAMISGKFVGMFNLWQRELEKLGYVNFAQVLNAKDYGVPQNRERIFLFSIRDDGDNPIFNFPKTIKLEKRLKDILETNVDEKYYLKEDRIKGFDGKRISNHQRGIVKQADDVANAIMNSDYKDAPKVAEIVEPQIVAMRGREPQVMTPKRTEYGKSIRKQYEAGEIQEQRKNIQQLEPRTDGVSNTLTSVQKDNLVMEPMIYDDYNGRFRDDQDTCGTLTTNCGNEASRNGFKIIEPINTDEDGNAATITAGYYKYGSKTLLGDTFGTSGTAVKEIKQITNNEQTRVFTEINETNTREVLRILWQEVGTQTFLEKMGRLGSFQKTQILQQRMYEESICDKGCEQPRERPCTSLCEENSLYDRGEREEMRNVWKDKWADRCSSQGWEFQQQFIREFNDCLSELPSETPQTEECLRYLRESEQDMPWLLQQTLSTLEEVRKSISGERNNYTRIRIRKLSERECFRLMDVSEEYIDIIQQSGVSRSQQYKMAGNSIVVSCLYHIFRKAFIETENENSQLTLF